DVRHVLRQRPHLVAIRQEHRVPGVMEHRVGLDPHARPVLAHEAALRSVPRCSTACRTNADSALFTSPASSDSVGSSTVSTTSPSSSYANLHWYMSRFIRSSHRASSNELSPRVVRKGTTDAMSQLSLSRTYTTSSPSSVS